MFYLLKDLLTAAMGTCPTAFRMRLHDHSVIATLSQPTDNCLPPELLHERLSKAIRNGTRLRELFDNRRKAVAEPCERP